MLSIFILLALVSSTQFACYSNNPECAELFTCGDISTYDKMNSCIMNNYYLAIVPLNLDCFDMDMCSWIQYNSSVAKKYVSYSKDINHKKIENTYFDSSNFGAVFINQIVNFFTRSNIVYIIVNEAQNN